jgi:benzylsuccinate CoA-transferase BbsE subunit
MMGIEQKYKAPLDHIRVLDLTDEKGQFCGKLLADLGADVIKIEPPGGDAVRRRAPFFHDSPDEERGLLWFAYNTNKKSVTLNLERLDGQRIFKILARKAALVLESYSPGYMSKLGLDYNNLASENPGIVMTSITPFGQTGPYSDYKAYDIVLMAMGGSMSICGDPDRPPVRESVEQAYQIAGAQAAMASVLALRFHSLTGEGQHVDVSMQECITPVVIFEMGQWEGEGYNAKRLGVRRRRGITYSRDLWPCKDGHIGWRLMGGRLGAPTMYALVEWMDSEGMAGELKEIKWESVDMSQLTQQELSRWEDIIVCFFEKHTKAEIYDMALNKRMLICPGYNIKELLNYKQLTERGFWEAVEYPEMGCTITHPGAFCKMSVSPLMRLHRSPLIGEHNEEIYLNELGLSRQDLIILKEQGII